MNHRAVSAIRQLAKARCLLALSFLCMNTTNVSGDSPALGAFSDHADVGKTGKAGSVEFDSATSTYVVAGGGENMWSTNDAFHFVWKQMSGDLVLAADIRWFGTNGNPHRKACLVIRQSLAPDSPYVDAALHGSGMTALQYRETPGGPTREIISNISAPRRVRLEKRGEYVSLSVAAPGEALQPASGSFRIQLQEPFYVGLAVCAHDNAALEKAVFANVELTPLPPAGNSNAAIESTLEILTIASLNRQVVYHTKDHIEAPNWSHDGKYFLFNSKGHIYKLPVGGGSPELLDTDFAIRCNNDHGISPAGTELVISDQTKQDGKSRIYVLPVTGGTPRLVTPLAPSYWHGWLPDGKTLAYCAERNGQFDIYTIPAAGGEEQRLTTAPGLDDGPEYSPDGKYIYFNSDRTGTMQIWRMHPDGSEQEPVVADEYNNWFAHPSPDGKWIIFLSYAKNVKGHPANQDVMLRLMPAVGGKIQLAAKLLGGQGTINVPSWSSDSKRVAFVSYQRVYP